MSGANGRPLPDPEAELRAMAEETPAVPGDFHARWTEAVRREAAAERKTAAAASWRRLAGVAAVFVFLVGGTLLTRNRLRPEKQTVLVSNRGAALSTAMPTEAREAPVLAAGAATEEIRLTALEDGTAAYDVAYVTSEEAEEDTALYEAEEDAAYYAADAALYDAGSPEAEAPMEAVTQMPTEMPMEMPTEVPTEAQAEAPKAAGLSLFLEDMGRFVLAALPYLAGAAVVLGGILWYRKKQQKKQ